MVTEINTNLKKSLLLVFERVLSQHEADIKIQNSIKDFVIKCPTDFTPDLIDDFFHSLNAPNCYAYFESKTTDLRTTIHHVEGLGSP